MKLKGKTSLVTGAARGIGIEVCRQLGREGSHVLIGVRTPSKGIQVQKQLAAQGIECEVVKLDVSDRDSISNFLAQKHNIDILINNAALYDRENDLMSVRDEDLELILRTNLHGPALLAKHLAISMRKKHWGRIVNVSSGMGSITRGFGADSPSYRISKLALNGLTVALADGLRGSGVLVNSVDPGWVQTEMGGPSATRTPEQGARSIVWAALIQDDGPTGGFFYDGQPAAW
jgi:NAD(P)-dependent dehydrogenase (short-subunit alcohol dehydrogenase family)